MTRYHTPLSEDEQRALGVSTPAPVAVADVVHHDELDSLNHVNNTTYMVWFERARMHFFEHYAVARLGVPEDPRMVIRSGEIHWIEEVLGGETYVLTTRCVAMRNTSLTLDQSVWSGGRKRVSFQCVMVLLERDSNARAPIPEDGRARLLADGARQD